MCEYRLRQLSARCADEEHPCDATAAILRGMSQNNELRKDAGTSVTMLTGCLRRSAYGIMHDYYWYPSRLWHAYRGTLGHLLMENGADPTNICEVRFARQFSGHLLTGKPDEYNPQRRLIIDYKTKEKPPEEAPVEYVEQVNAYRLLLTGGYNLSTGQEARYEADTMGLVFLMNNEYRKLPVPLSDESNCPSNSPRGKVGIGSGPSS